MTRALIIGGTLAALLVLVVLSVRQRARELDARRADGTPAALPGATIVPQTSGSAAHGTDSTGFLYGRVTTLDGGAYEGRLRFGAGDEEAFWGDFFNGVKHENFWLPQLSPEQVPKRHSTVRIFGWKMGERDEPLDVTRQLVTSFGSIARIESLGKTVRVTLKSGSVFDVNRFDASDFDDGVRVWDATRGAVDLDSLQIRSIELLPTPKLGDVPSRLHGTVRSRQGEFTGFVEWNRVDGSGTDELHGRGEDRRDLVLRFDAIRSIERRTPHNSLVTLLDGRKVELAPGDRGISVDDPRFGRVVISWNAFERVDFDAGGSGPAYGDFAPGRPLRGSVTTRDGRRLAGRLVYDLDESETTETLDAPSQGVDYSIPFGLVSSIAAEQRKVTLVDGQEVQFERDGDLGEQNAGVLVFAEGGGRPEYVPWADVARVDFER